MNLNLFFAGFLGIVLLLGSIPLSISDSDVEPFANPNAVSHMSQTAIDVLDNLPGSESEDDKLSSKNPVPLLLFWDGFPRIENLTNTSTDIIIGKISKVKSYSDNELPITKFEVVIQETIKGNLTNGEKIDYIEVGSADLTLYNLMNGRISLPGEEFVLFLIYYEPLKYYSNVGGPQGQFIIKNSKVSSLDVEDSRLNWVSVKENEKPIQQFIAEIKLNISEKKS